VVILCGGRGTRLQGAGPSLPKPLVEIGGRPIVWHVMSIYAAQGFREFILCTGYKHDDVEAFVTGERWPEDMSVRCIDTGLDTPTGGRIRRAATTERLIDKPFCATYADGVADIDLVELLAFHRRHESLATVTVVRPELQWGVADIDTDDAVLGFHEKPRLDHWINGGFFCFEPGSVDYLSESSVLEREPLEGLAGDGQLRAFRHTGFWECMDTYKDAIALNDLWDRGDPPWKVWS
jgi:glucose-1-phosphate cytidylyltransferase